MEKLQGWVQNGNVTVVTSGVSSTNVVQGSYPLSQVAVYNAGTLVLATIYSDNGITPKANPFTSSANGAWFFYAANARYDITFSGGSIPSPFTLSDWLLNDISSGITSLNGLTAPTQTFAVGTAGSDFAISSATSTHTFNLPTATAAHRGALSSADWSTFNAKQGALTFSSPLANTAGTISLGTVPIANGGTGQTAKTAAMNALSPQTTKGDLPIFNGTDVVRFPVGADGTALIADSSQATGWKSAAVPSSPVAVANGGTGLTTLTGVPYGTGTSALTPVAAASQLQVFRRQANVSTTAYEFATVPWINAADFNFPSQTPGGTLTATVGASITLTPVPLGINGTDVSHRIYISGGTGTAEAVLITGGSATSGAASGTITFTPANNHSGAWTVTSATQGIQEAISYASAGSNEVLIPTGANVLNANVSFGGKTNLVIKIANGATFSGAGTLPTPGAGTFIVDYRSASMWPGKGADLTSGATIAPTNQVHHVTGTAAVATITVPAGIQVGYAIWLIADAAFTTTTGGNIGRAITATANTAYAFVWDGTKWYPALS